jgi:hypothetical protein
MNRYKWGEVKNNKDYYADETVRRMIYTHRNLISMLAQIMFKERYPDEKILDILDKWYEEFPHEIIPYDAIRDNSISIAAAYKLIHDRTSDSKKASDLQEKYIKIASAAVNEQLEYLEWYNGLRDKLRNEVLIYTRLNILTQAINILGNDGAELVPTNKLANILARNIETECNSIMSDRAGMSKATIDRKLQLIDYMYDILSGAASIQTLDKKLAATLKHICNIENRRLNRYNVNRLQESDAEEILASLQVIASAYKMAENLNNREDAIIKDIKEIYDINVEKYAPYVLNY